MENPARNHLIQKFFLSRGPGEYQINAVKLGFCFNGLKRFKKQPVIGIFDDPPKGGIMSFD